MANVLELELFNPEDNSSMVFVGELQRDQASAGIKETTTASTGNSLAEDSTGALMFVVAVISVYGMSMCLLVITLTRKKSASQITDKEVRNYIKGIEAARQEAKAEEVLRSRLRWPGNFIGLRFSSRNPIAASRLDQEGEEPERSSQNTSVDVDSMSDYVEMPATTVAMVDGEEDASDDPEDSEGEIWIKHPVKSDNDDTPRIPSGRRVSIAAELPTARSPGRGRADYYRMMAEADRRVQGGQERKSRKDYLKVPTRYEGPIPTVTITDET